MSTDDADPREALADPAAFERVLLTRHGQFLGFLERRLGSRADAEEVLQAAYVRTMEGGAPDHLGPDDVDTVAWFYRVLRNAMVDHWRRQGSARRAAERLALEQETQVDPELRAAICACLYDVIPSLKAEYGEVVRAVDLEGRAIAEVASDHRIAVNNARVRLHRARQALKRGLQQACGACAAHGCLECRCRKARTPGGTTEA